MNKITHGCLEIWNFSSRVQFNISHVRCADFWDIKSNTRRGIPYLLAPMYLTIVPRAGMGSESIAHEAEGRMGY